MLSKPKISILAYVLFCGKFIIHYTHHGARIGNLRNDTLSRYIRPLNKEASNYKAKKIDKWLRTNCKWRFFCAMHKFPFCTQICSLKSHTNPTCVSRCGVICIESKWLPVMRIQLSKLLIPGPGWKHLPINKRRKSSLTRKWHLLCEL